MIVVNAPVEKSIELENQIFLLKIYCPTIAESIQPGQFLNIRVSETNSPLLRRPFSICDADGEFIYIMFNIYGEGTRILANKRRGETIDILGPLGKGFNIDDDYEHAVIIAGGLGAAPFPYLTRKLLNNKKITTFVGGRTHADVIKYGLLNIQFSTDDGSLGRKGNVIELFSEHLGEFSKEKIKIFACGPTAMLKGLKEYISGKDLSCEMSTECAMACGFGICMGCPIEPAGSIISDENPGEKYLLVCKDGPVFKAEDIIL